MKSFLTGSASTLAIITTCVWVSSAFVVFQANRTILVTPGGSLSLTCVNEDQTQVDFKFNSALVGSCIYSIELCSEYDDKFQITANVTESYRYTLETVYGFNLTVCGLYECRDVSTGASDNILALPNDFDNKTYGVVEDDDKVQITTSCIFNTSNSEVTSLWSIYDNTSSTLLDLALTKDYVRLITDAHVCSAEPCGAFHSYNFTIGLSFPKPTTMLTRVFLEVEVIYPLVPDKPLKWRSSRAYALKDIDQCASNPCQNGGSCKDMYNAFTCSCKASNTGVFCEKDIDQCASNPCQNGGSCKDMYNAFTCSCKASNTGVFCEKEAGDDCSKIGVGVGVGGAGGISITIIIICVAKKKKIRFIRKLLDLQVLRGEKAHFICKVENSSDDPQWFHNDSLLTSNGRIEIKSESNIHRLTILSTHLGDSGIIKVKFEKESCSATLVCLDTPDIFLWKLLDLQILMDKDAHFCCKVEQSKLAPQWYHDEELLTSDDRIQIKSNNDIHRLTVRITSLDDYGKYKVVIGKQFSCAWLEVLRTPDMFNRKLHDLQITQKKDVQFMCKVENSMYSPQWYHDENLLMSGDRKTIKSERNPYTLTVRNTRLDDSGIYKVVFGDHFCCARLEVLQTPGIIQRKLTDMEISFGEDAMFLCQLISTSEQPLWYHDDTQIEENRRVKIKKSGDTHILTIHCTEYEDAGKYMIQIGEFYSCAYLEIRSSANVFHV